MSTEASVEEQLHIFVGCQHGIHGQPKNFHAFKKTLEEEVAAHNNNNASPGHVAAPRRPHLNVRVFDTSANRFHKSLHGTAVCGARLAEDCLADMHKWIEAIKGKENNSAEAEEAVRPVRLVFACVGHSFGGIMWREAIPTIMKDPTVVASGVEFVSYVTIATPHCGAHSLRFGLEGAATALGYMGFPSYSDLVLKSDAIRVNLVDEEHLEALSKFDNRMLVSSVCNDLFVRFETGSLCFPDNASSHPEASEAKDIALALVTANGGATEIAYPDVYPHVLPPFVVGSNKGSGADADPPTADSTPLRPPETPLEGDEAAIMTAEAKIANILKKRMSFQVVPVLPEGTRPNAHKALMCTSLFGRGMPDVLQYVVRQMIEQWCQSSTPPPSSADGCSETTTPAPVEPQVGQDRDETPVDESP